MSDNRTRLAVAGMDHGHVYWILRKLERDDVAFVGFYDAEPQLSARYASEFGIASEQVYNNLDTMLDEVKPDGVVAFSSIYRHLEAVQACAPRGIHVMVEKPLAVSMEHAQAMKSLADQNNIHLLTNFETTWYASNHEIYRMVKEGQLGDIRKITVRDGHQGPQELGCGPEFLAWLTDPILNGGGAIIDFGCYGANLVTWLMNNQRPLTVTAITQTHKPEIYPKVDDDSVIILTYPKMQAMIQGSWNWTFPIKDMQVFGQTGSAHAVDRTTLSYHTANEGEIQMVNLDERAYPHSDPFSYFGAVIRDEITVGDDDLYGLTNNMLVVEILDAARESARTGQTVSL